MEGARGSDSGQGIAGGMIPGSGAPAFTLENLENAAIPVLIAAPHGGRAYPARIADAMRNPAIVD